MKNERRNAEEWLVALALCIRRSLFFIASPYPC